MSPVARHVLLTGTLPLVEPRPRCLGREPELELPPRLVPQPFRALPVVARTGPKPPFEDHLGVAPVVPAVVLLPRRPVPWPFDPKVGVRFYGGRVVERVVRLRRRVRLPGVRQPRVSPRPRLDKVGGAHKKATVEVATVEPKSYGGLFVLYVFCLALSSREYLVVVG